MALMHTPICDFGWKAKDFSAHGTDGKTYTFSDIRGEKGTLVVFICNHCPYVRAIADRLAEEINALREIGIGTIAIMSNDTSLSPGDSFDEMKRFADAHGFTFPYAIDESQDIARAYGAVCTPDFFGFNADDELQYRGRLDESKMQLVKGAKRELYDAMKMIAETGQGPKDQIASMGCSIKWRDAA
jgi:peroxiredoxin